MSDKLPQQHQNEEVDLGQLFNAIGRLFEKLFAFIGNLLKGLFSITMYALKPLVANFKLVAIVVMVTAVFGFVLEKFSRPVYVSDMLVKPYFNSKYQLANNIDYFNALISSQNLPELSKIFEIDSTSAKELISFEIEIGPETPNDLLVEYDAYLKRIDSTLAGDVSYEYYIDNRDILSGSIFSIIAKSHKKDIFPSLESGFEKTFKNEYSEKLKEIRDESINTKQKSYNNDLKRMDSLQRVYLDVLRNESKEGSYKLGGESMLPIIKERLQTREFELFQEELKIRDSLRVLEELLIVENDYYDILSSFENVGTAKKDLFSKYSMLFPLIAILLMSLVYFSLKAFKFIKEYE